MTPSKEDPSKETPESASKSDNSVAIKAISASVMVLFTTFMIVHWQRLLSKTKTDTETAASTSVNKAAPGTEEPKKTASEAAPSRESEVTEVETESEGTESAAVSAETEADVTEELVETEVETGETESAAVSAETEPEPEVTEELVETEVETESEGTESAAVSGEDSSPTAEVIEDLYYQVYNKVDESWRINPSFESNLAYKVNVKANGAIASYEPINEVAVDYLSETPMESLVDAGGGKSAKATEPVASFLVVLTPSGRLEVSPWLAK